MRPRSRCIGRRSVVSVRPVRPEGARRRTTARPTEPSTGRRLADDGREAYTFARLGYVALTAHEFGHHLQLTTGMVNEYGKSYAEASKTNRYLLSRRLELQAQCFEGVFLQTVSRSIRLNAVDRDELRMWHSYTGDEDPPSSREAGSWQQRCADPLAQPWPRQPEFPPLQHLDGTKPPITLYTARSRLSWGRKDQPSTRLKTSSTGRGDLLPQECLGSRIRAVLKPGQVAPRLRRRRAPGDLPGQPATSAGPP